MGLLVGWGRCAGVSGGGGDVSRPGGDEEAEEGLEGCDEQVEVSFESVAVSLDDDLDEAAEPGVSSLGGAGVFCHRWSVGADRGYGAQRDFDIPLLHGFLVEDHFYCLGNDRELSPVPCFG